VSFRKEEKIRIDQNQLFNLLDWIHQNGGFKLYETRTISSTYFDNDQMQMFLDSEEGCVPRKKIRVRSYSKQTHKTSQSSLEIKTSSVEGRHKVTNKDFDLKKIMTIGYFDKDYGICKPKVRVSYSRAYYKVHDVRLTIDRYIEYTKINSQGKGFYKCVETDIVGEIKAEDFVPIEYLHKKFHFDRVRFSKYSKAISIVI
jgi:hypothetical protein